MIRVSPGSGGGGGGSGTFTAPVSITANDAGGALSITTVSNPALKVASSSYGPGFEVSITAAYTLWNYTNQPLYINSYYGFTFSTDSNPAPVRLAGESYLQIAEMSFTPAVDSNTAVIYVRAGGSGTELVARFSSGSESVLATG